MDIAPVFASPFFVGAVGALVSLRFGHDETWRQRLTTFVCGWLTAGYFARPLSGWLKLTEEGDVLGIAFAIGLLGLSVIAAVLKGIGDLEVAKIVSSWTTRR